MSKAKDAAVASGWRDRLRRSVTHESTALTVLALLVGVGAGAGAVGFRYMILGFTYLFSGHRDYCAAGDTANPLVPGLGMWFVVVAPVIGGLIYGRLVAGSHRRPAGMACPR